MNQTEQMGKNEEQLQKNIERKRREQKLRRWLTTMSWSTPVLAFTGFFGLWNHIGSPSTGAASTTATTTPSSSRVVQAATTSGDKVLFQTGSTGSQVSALQQQLAELGYFNHEVTQYYGPVTAQAVEAFQAGYGLSVTGKVDEKTLVELRHALRQRGMTALLQSSGSAASSGSTQSSTAGQSSSSFTQSQSSQSSSPSSLSRAS